MAAQRVQRYLDKHKIGPLFESLMAQVIQDTPDDPIGYIIKILQGMHKKQRNTTDLDDDVLVESRSPSRKSILRSSQNETNSMKSGSNNLAASWSAGEPQERSKSRDYQRPWTSNRKSIENKTWSPEQNSRQTRGGQSPKTWNNDTRVPTHDFDEWFQLQNSEEKLSPRQEKYHKYRGVKSWNAQEQNIKENSNKLRDTQISGDELESELKLGKHKTTKESDDYESSLSPTVVSRSRPMKAKRAIEEHRQHLQTLLLGENRQKSNELRNLRNSPEEGMEILENIEELQEEGVNKTVKKGAKLNKAKRNSSNENVSVTICARCARIIGKADEINSSSEVGSVFNEKNSSSFERVTWKDNMLDDHDTSSEASDIMINRTRQNIWPVGSDTESDITPRNDKSFKRLQSSSEKVRTYRDYRREMTYSPELSSRPSTSRTSKLKQSEGFTNSFRKSWGTNGYSSDNETEVEPTRPSTPGSMSGQPWNIPSDNNTDDESKHSRPGKTGFSKTKRSTGRSRRFTLDTSSSVGDTDY